MAKKKPQLIKSTSGIRGVVGNGLDPIMITAYGAAFGSFLKKGKVIVGSDTRPSRDMVKNAVISGLIAVGVDVVDVGIVPTPTVEIAVKALKAAGGICVTASHNPGEWNALKFFNNTGEFVTPTQYKKLDAIFNANKFAYQPVEKLGKISYDDRWIDEHIKKTLKQKVVRQAAIKKRKFTVVVDAINGAGSEALPALLEKLGVKVIGINCKGDGDFVHMPEPTPKNLQQLARAVKKHQADLGMACDPDADRLALIDDRGKAVSEELTLTIAVKEVLSRKQGPTVINLSTSSATADVARAMNSQVYYSRVGEANVVDVMSRRKAVIGGEGNGGVIFPEFHAGRDSLIAAALVLSCLAREKISLSGLVDSLPKYYNVKSKAPLPSNFERRLLKFEKEAGDLLGKVKIDRRDGRRFDFREGWVQIRASNTEPIFRLIIETNDPKLTDTLYKQVLTFFK